MGSTAIGICISEGKKISCRINADYHSLAHAQQGSKNKALDAIEKDLNKFQSSFKQDSKLHDIILDPTIKHSVKAATLKDVSPKIKYNPATGFLLERPPTSTAHNARIKLEVSFLPHLFLLIY